MHGAHPHRATLRDHDITTIGDTSVTSIARTLVDVARHRPIGSGVAAFDAALHDNRIVMGDIEDVLLFCWTWPRIRRAQRAVRLCDARSESPLESISRLVLGWLRLPTPELQTDVFNPFGRFVGRSDFYWDDVGVIGEADGRAKYDERSVLLREKDRQEALEELGLVVVRWGWDDVTRKRLALRERIEHAFDRGRRRDRSGFPRLWTL
jgi:very-short-patch-repair endonuclease